MTRLLVLGIHNDATSLLDTDTGEILNPLSLVSRITVGTGGILVGTHLYRHVGRLNEQFHKFPGWTVQVRSKKRDVLRGEKRSVIGSFLPVQFGFTFSNSKCGGQNRKRNPPRIFHCMDLEDIIGVQSVSLTESLSYARSIMDLCSERGITFTAGRGSLAARMLKASPEWKAGRTAAPEFVNDTARVNLPGNYYGLGAVTTKTYRSALYLDQVSAHHAVAACTPIPHPVFVRARGNHRKLEAGIRDPWVKDPHQVPGHGLLACMASVSHIPDARKHLFPPFLHEQGRKLVYIYSNELGYFDGVHATIEYVCAAWTSPVADPAVAEYARWALGARSEGPGRKPLLLAAYGALALRTDRPSVTYHQTSRRVGLTSYLPGAGPMKETSRLRKPDQPQPPIVNVLARGMIEAETRRRSLELANELDRQGIPVLSIYVDGIIAETDALPLLPPGWQVESQLTNLRFSNPSSFIANEMAKQPGIPKDLSQAAKMMLANRKRVCMIPDASQPTNRKDLANA